MNKEKVIQDLKDNFDLITPYILNDLQSYDWQPLEYINQVEYFGNHLRIVNDDELTIYDLQDIEHESEYKYSILVSVHCQSNKKHKALIKLQSNLFLKIEFS
jgi:hypothetical protein